MEDYVKDILRTAVNSDTLKNVQDTFSRHWLIQDESFFDYELLKAALERKHLGIANFLLKIGCRVRNPNIVNSESETALHLAMKVNNAGIIKKMLKKGASINEKNHNGETALYAAFVGKYYNAVAEALTFVSTVTCKHLEDLLEPNYFTGLDPTNVDNIRHFQIACVTDHEAAVRYFLNYSFDVNGPLILNSTKFFGLNPLHYATFKPCINCLDTLLEKGADISIKNSNGKTPLQIIYYSDFTLVNIGMIEQIFCSENNTKYINSVDTNGVSHFHMSCAINYSEHAQVFIDNGVDVNRPISSNCSKYPGYTPLHIAVMQGCEKVVQLLLENGADCKEKSTDGTTALHLACKLPTNEVKYFIIRMLLKYNACPAAVDKYNCTPLHLAFSHINLFQEKEIFDMFISKIPREVNFTDNKGLSHFHIVCIVNDTSRIKNFLESGVDVNSCVSSGMFSGYTALHFAVLYNQKDAVEELLKWNAQVNIQTNNLKRTPLHLACNFDREKFLEMEFVNKSTVFNWDLNRKNQLYIIKLLLLQGADVESQDSVGETPLFSTCKIDPFFYHLNSSEINERIKQIIEILLLNKANLNACTDDQRSILHVISELNICPYDSEELVEYLITAGANIDAKDYAGITPLHVAVKQDRTDLVRIFVKHQANVNVKSFKGLIPLQMIVKYNDWSSYETYIDSSSNAIACILLENDSYVNVGNINSKTLLQIAIESRNIFITKKFLYYGADINIEDKFGNSPVSCLFEWNDWNDNVSFATIFQILFIHIQKLLALGLYVSERVQMCFIKLRQSYESILNKEAILKTTSIGNLDNVFDNCLEELDKMKLIKIDNYTSLYNILVKDTHEISKYVRNSTLIQILEDPNIDNNFPLYSFLLKLKYKKGLKRNDVLKLAEKALQCTIKLNLPDLCYDSVLKYLSNEDIVNMKLAVSINNYKRKLSNNVSCASEPQAKLTKKL